MVIVIKIAIKIDFSESNNIDSMPVMSTIYVHHFPIELSSRPFMVSKWKILSLANESRRNYME